METESAEAKKENAAEFSPKQIETLGKAFADGCFIEPSTIRSTRQP